MDHITAETVIPALLTIIVFVLIWAALRTTLILSSEDHMLGIRIPQIKRLNPVVLAAKSDFKRRNTRIFWLFSVVIAVLMYLDWQSALYQAAIILPIAQAGIGLLFWFLGRRAIRAERQRSGWSFIGDASADLSSAQSASQSAQDQFVYRHKAQQPVPRSFDQLVFPPLAGWLFIASFAVTVAGTYVLWLNWAEIPDPIPPHMLGFMGQNSLHDKTMWTVFSMPLLAGISGLVVFIGTYSLSIGRAGSTPLRRVALRGLENGLGLLTLLTMVMMNLVAISGLAPAVEEQSALLDTLGIVSFWVGVAGLVVFVVLPSTREYLRIRRGEDGDRGLSENESSKENGGHRG